MWQRNGTADWVNQLSDDQKSKLFEKARQSVQAQKTKVMK